MNEPLPFRYFWLIAIGTNVVNAFISKVRSRRYTQQRPELADGYRRAFIGTLVWGSLPWLVMGFGLTVGEVPHLTSYFDPKAGNPYVLAWFGSIIALWLLAGYWLFVRRGAEFLIEHPGLINYNGKNPTVIRGFYGFMTISSVISLYLLFTGVFPGAHH